MDLNQRPCVSQSFLILFFKLAQTGSNQGRFLGILQVHTFVNWWSSLNDLNIYLVHQNVSRSLVLVRWSPAYHSHSSSSSAWLTTRSVHKTLLECPPEQLLRTMCVREVLRVCVLSLDCRGRSSSVCCSVSKPYWAGHPQQPSHHSENRYASRTRF